jgi:hypothetical protein
LTGNNILSKRRGCTVKLPGLLILLVVLPLLSAQLARHKNDRQEPCSVPVPPIRNNRGLVVSVSMDYTYTAKDPPLGRTWLQRDVVATLNNLGGTDGNAFAPQNGNPVNVYLTYTINNDGQDHYTGSLEFSGWGQGHISTFSTPYSYTDPEAMTRYLTAQAYAYIQNGWHDTRPGCENGPGKKRKK